MQQSNSNTDIFNSTDPETIYSLVQNVFSTTKCYDIMQNSSKVLGFVDLLDAWYIDFKLASFLKAIFSHKFVARHLGYRFRDNYPFPISFLRTCRAW